MVPTACKFQYLMVAKVEDTANLKEEDLKPNPEFPFAFLYQMCWWKNVVEESNAPGQTLVSSNLQALLHSSTSWHFIGSVVSLCTLHWEQTSLWCIWNCSKAGYKRQVVQDFERSKNGERLTLLALCWGHLAHIQYSEEVSWNSCYALWLFKRCWFVW